MLETKFHIHSVTDILYRFELIGGLLEDCQIGSFNILFAVRSLQKIL